MLIGVNTEGIKLVIKGTLVGWVIAVGVPNWVFSIIGCVGLEVEIYPAKGSNTFLLVFFLPFKRYYHQYNLKLHPQRYM
jgi:hypothetical protein